jgi:TRAP-type transport system periplasmic protein
MSDKHVFRRSVIGALALSAGLLTATAAVAQSQPVKWRLNSAYEFEGYSADMIRWFAERIKQASNGRLIIEPHFSSSLGFKSDEALRSVSQGSAEMNLGYISAGEERLAAFVYMPYLFDRTEDWIRWGYTDYKPVLDKRLQDKWQVKVLSLFTFPEVRVWSKKPLTKLEDFKGLKIRAPGGLPTGRLMSELGATVVAIPTAEVYTSMQRGLAEALQTSAVTFTEQRLWEVAKYAQHPPLAGDVGNALIVSMAALDRLPEDLRKIVLETGADVEAYALGKFLTKYNAELNAKVQANGVQLVELDPSLKQKLTEIMPALYRKWAAEIGPDAERLIKAAGR